MQATRRTVALGLVAATLAACSGGPRAAAPAREAPDPAMQPVPNPGLRRLGGGLPAAGAGRRHFAGDLRHGLPRRRLPARRDRARPQPDRVHPHARGLPRHRRLGRAGQQRPGGAAPARPHAGADRGALRRRAAGGRRGLGPGEQLRHPARHACRWSRPSPRSPTRAGAARFFEQQLIAALRILQNGDTTAAGHDRQLGRGHGAHPVHPHLVSRLRRRLRRRRPARHLVGRPDRRARLRRRLPLALGLAARPALGRRGAPAGRASAPARPAAAPPAARATGRRRACATWTAGRCRTTARPRSSSRWARAARPS